MTTSSPSGTEELLLACGCGRSLRSLNLIAFGAEVSLRRKAKQSFRD
jgi:hypothetical protein